MIIILGAGITGLSVGFHLKNRDYTVFEREDHPGGLCTSTYMDDFVFDKTGHLLHLKNSSSFDFINPLLKDNLARIERKAAVFSHGKYIPYPFQAHTFALPKDAALECVLGFVENRKKKRKPASFKNWVLQNFGGGFAKHFFLPYNSKFWQTDLDSITADWAQWSIPVPQLHEVLRGALGFENSGMGYNSYFFYPAHSGINVLPDALSREVRNLSLNSEAVSLNMKKKSVTFKNGKSAEYEKLVSTLPLPKLLSLIEDLPAKYRSAISGLSYLSVQCLNLGINRKDISPYHWIYFPEKEAPFYRVGFYSNFTKDMAPKNTSSCYVESTFLNRKMDEKHFFETSIEWLKRCGILKKQDTVVAKQYIEIEHAYVMFDFYRKRHLQKILHHLGQQNIFSIGRYGSWDYMSMEDCLIQGRDIAWKI